MNIDQEKAEYWLKELEKSPRGQCAMGLFLEGYNCTQSVVLAFADLIEMDEGTLLRMSSSFGGGMGRLREVCGAVSGMFLVAGYLYGYDLPGVAGQQAKAEHYARIQQLAAEYRTVNGSIVCRELLGLGTSGADDPTPEPRTEEYYKKRPCGQMIGLAAAMLERYVEEQGKESAGEN